MKVLIEKTLSVLSTLTHEELVYYSLGCIIAISQYHDEQDIVLDIPVEGLTPHEVKHIEKISYYVQQQIGEFN